MKKSNKVALQETLEGIKEWLCDENLEENCDYTILKKDEILVFFCFSLYEKRIRRVLLGSGMCPEDINIITIPYNDIEYEQKIKRQDYVDNAIYDLMDKLTGEHGLDWNIDAIGKVRDTIIDVVEEYKYWGDEGEFYP